MKQREIKYRIWTGSMMEQWNHVRSIAPAHFEKEWMVLMFTGLKDKNGREIYEGDVVEAKSWIPQLWMVEFIEGGFCFTNPKMTGSPIDINMMFSSTGPACEVIGNIYENPELLNR